MLGELLDELEGLLDDPDDPELRRLVPARVLRSCRQTRAVPLARRATSSSPGARRLWRPSRETLVRARRSTSSQADQWLRALNDMRLVLGTRWDVTEQLDYGQLDLDEPRGR